MGGEWNSPIGKLYKPVITGEMRNEYNRKNRELLSASFSIIFCRKLIWLSSYEKKTYFKLL
jgi:hypothetical protein